MQVLVFCNFVLKMPIHSPFGGFGHIPPQKMSLIVLTPQKDRPWAEPRHLSYEAWISAARFELAVGGRKKGQDRKKSQKGYISPIWREARTEAIYIKNCAVSYVLDVITCAKFQHEISRLTILQGVTLSIFPIDFWMVLTTVQRYCAACDWSSDLIIIKSSSATVHRWNKDNRNENELIY